MKVLREVGIYAAAGVGVIAYVMLMADLALAILRWGGWPL